MNWIKKNWLYCLIILVIAVWLSGIWIAMQNGSLAAWVNKPLSEVKLGDIVLVALLASAFFRWKK
jgi:hypothetical protein